MIFKILLLPFQYFIIGLNVVLIDIISILKTIFLFVGKYIILGLKLVILLVRNIIKLLTIISTKVFKLIMLLVKALFRVIKIILVTVLKIIKFIIINLILGLKQAIIYLYISIKFIVNVIYKVIATFIKYLIKFIIITLRVISKVLQYIFNILYKTLKFMVNKMVNIMKLFIKIPIFLWLGLKSLLNIIYKVISSPFIYIYKLIIKIAISIGDFFQTIIDNLKEKSKELSDLPKTIKKGLIDWYSNLAFIKDLKNRREMKRQTLLIDFETEDAVRSEQKVAYRFVAKNPEGKIEKGKLSAYSKLDVHSYLLAEGYEIYEIDVFKGLGISVGGRKSKVKINELVFLLTQLSTYIKAGIPLVDSIKILSKQNKKGEKRDLYKAIIYELTMGESFSEALAKQGNAFPKLLINMIKSAELAGNLPETLDNMSEYYDAVNKTKKQMLTAMMYPAVISVFATVIIAFILVFVIPEFVGIYRDLGSELPAITRFTIEISDFLQNNIILIVLGFIALSVSLTVMYSNIKMFKLLIQWLLMRMPVVGNIIIYNEVTMFSKTFGSLLNHNVFITDSMEILSKITNNEIYKMLIFDTITNLARGESISKSFKDHWAFPIVAYQMLLTGERTGQPGPMMNKVADYYQEEHRNVVNQIKVFIEPVMIVVLTVVVGFILLSVILPMFSLYGGLGV